MSMREKVRKLKSNQPEQPTNPKQPQNQLATGGFQDLTSTFHPLHSVNSQPQNSHPIHQRHSSNPIQSSNSQDYAPIITLNGHMQKQSHLATANFEQKQASNSHSSFFGTNSHQLQNRRSHLNDHASNIQTLNKSAVTFDNWATMTTFGDLSATTHKTTEPLAENIVEMSIIESVKEENEAIDLDQLSPPNAAQPLPIERPPASLDKSSDKLGKDSSQSQSNILGRKTSKLKLRDYIYMVESTARHSLSKGKSGLNSSDSLTIEKKQAKEPEANSSLAKTAKQNTITRRKEQSSSKYSIPSGEMVEIIKKEVKEDIARITEQLGRIDEQMREVHPHSNQQAISMQLLCLYQVRRQVKEEISKRIEATLALLLTEKNRTNGEGKSWTEKQSCSYLSNKQ